MQKLVDKLLVAVYLALATLPILAMAIGLKGREVFGALQPAPRPTPTWTAVTSEKFQHGFTAWFESTLGLKGTSIALDNAALYHLFRETKPGAPVVIGDDDVLFLNEDVAYFSTDSLWLKPEYVNEVAGKIANVQHRFAAEGRAFVPMIIPSKTSLWRDKLPARWRMIEGEPASDERVYGELKRALARHGVAFVDGRALMTQSTMQRELLFAPDARHWSNYSACLAMREVARVYGELTHRPMPPYECSLVTRGGRRFADVDYDLWRLLNSYGVKTGSPVIATVAHPNATPTTSGPSVLFTGSSFCWQLAADADSTGMFGLLTVNYYNKTFAKLGTETKVEPGTDVWRENVLGKDLYVLDLFETYFGTYGAYSEQFLNDLLAELERPR